MMKISLYTLITAAILFGAGCANVNKSYPERTYYQFDVTYKGHKGTPVKGTILGVRRLSVSPGSEGIEFIYRTGEFEYRSDFYNQFFRPPGALMTEAVTTWFLDAGIFEEVLGQLSQSLPNYIIEGNVIKLFGDFRQSAAPKAVMEIQLYLLKTTDDDDFPIVITSNTYSLEKPISSRDPNALMQGWNQAFEEILGEFLKDVKKNLRRSMQHQSQS